MHNTPGTSHDTWLTVQVDGEDEGTQVQETDIVTCSARVILRRASHSSPGALLPATYPMTLPNALSYRESLRPLTGPGTDSW